MRLFSIIPIMVFNWFIRISTMSSKFGDPVTKNVIFKIFYKITYIHILIANCLEYDVFHKELLDCRHGLFHNALNILLTFKIIKII